MESSPLTAAIVAQLEAMRSTEPAAAAALELLAALNRDVRSPGEGVASCETMSA